MFSGLAGWINPNNLDQSSRANDVIVIQHSDGLLRCTPFNVRFGKYKMWNRSNKIVQVEVNGCLTKAVMKLSDTGEAYWLQPAYLPTPHAPAKTQQEAAAPHSTAHASVNEPLMDEQNGMVEGAQFEYRPESPVELDEVQRPSTSEKNNDEPFTRTTKSPSCKRVSFAPNENAADVAEQERDENVSSVEHSEQREDAALEDDDSSEGVFREREPSLLYKEPSTGELHIHNAGIHDKGDALQAKLALDAVTAYSKSERRMSRRLQSDPFLMEKAAKEGIVAENVDDSECDVDELSEQQESNEKVQHRISARNNKEKRQGSQTAAKDSSTAKSCPTVAVAPVDTVAAKEEQTLNEDDDNYYLDAIDVEDYIEKFGEDDLFQNSSFDSASIHDGEGDEGGNYHHYNSDVGDDVGSVGSIENIDPSPRIHHDGLVGGLELNVNKLKSVEVYFTKSLIPMQDDLRKLNLKPGVNEVRYIVWKSLEAAEAANRQSSETEGTFSGAQSSNGLSSQGTTTTLVTVKDNKNSTTTTTSTTSGGATTTTAAASNPKGKPAPSKDTSAANSSNNASKGDAPVLEEHTNYVCVRCNIFLWSDEDKIVISDVDGTITKSDLWGHYYIMRKRGAEWSHPGICRLYNRIERNGYKIVYLTARSVTQIYQTKNYLFTQLKQEDGENLPLGPVLTVPEKFFTALTKEVTKQSHIFKIACLTALKDAFMNPVRSLNRKPFFAGFGNRYTDVVSYDAVGVPQHKIFIIDENSVLHCCKVKHSYNNLAELVNETFPPVSHSNRMRFANQLALGASGRNDELSRKGSDLSVDSFGQQTQDFKLTSGALDSDNEGTPFLDRSPGNGNTVREGSANTSQDQFNAMAVPLPPSCLTSFQSSKPKTGTKYGNYSTNSANLNYNTNNNNSNSTAPAFSNAGLQRADTDPISSDRAYIPNDIQSQPADIGTVGIDIDFNSFNYWKVDPNSLIEDKRAKEEEKKKKAEMKKEAQNQQKIEKESKKQKEKEEKNVAKQQKKEARRSKKSSPAPPENFVNGRNTRQLVEMSDEMDPNKANLEMNIVSILPTLGANTNDPSEANNTNTNNPNMVIDYQSIYDEPISSRHGSSQMDGESTNTTSSYSNNNSTPLNGTSNNTITFSRPSANGTGGNGAYGSDASGNRGAAVQGNYGNKNSQLAPLVRSGAAAKEAARDNNNQLGDEPKKGSTGFFSSFGFNRGGNSTNNGAKATRANEAFLRAKQYAHPDFLTLTSTNVTGTTNLTPDNNNNTANKADGGGWNFWRKKNPPKPEGDSTPNSKYGEDNSARKGNSPAQDKGSPDSV